MLIDDVEEFAKNWPAQDLGKLVSEISSDRLLVIFLTNVFFIALEEYVSSQEPLLM